MDIEIFGLIIPFWMIISCVIFILGYKYLTKSFGIFKNIGVKGPKPWPIFGTIFPAFIKGLAQLDIDNIKKFGNVLGIFQGSTPRLLVADVEMLKEIMVKGFNNFTNRADFGIKEKPVEKFLIDLKDEEWRNIRNIITPTFSCSKLRRMEAQMNKCARLMVENLRKKAHTNEPYDVKEHMGAFIMDVIASTAFGLDVDSQGNPQNPFTYHAQKVLNRFSLRNPALFIHYFLPFLKPLTKRIGLNFFPKDTINFFRRIIDSAMASRTQADRKTRTDFLQLMANAHKDVDGIDEEDVAKEEGFMDTKKVLIKPCKSLSYDDIFSQCFTFFIAGYGTAVDALSFISYSIAKNPIIQEKMVHEIESTVVGEQDIDYDILKKFHYMDMVINETLRIYPPLPRINRICSQDTTINGITIPKGIIIDIPVQAIHMDPTLWPDPEKFDPERFSPAEKARREPYSWMPFGMGPRRCIAMRLSLMEIKIGLVYLLQNFKIKFSEKTKLQRNKLIGSPEHLFLELEERNK